MTNFRFIHPRQDGSLTDVSIMASNLAEAFQQYARDCWLPVTDGATGVWQGHVLVARVVPVVNRKTAEREPHIQLWR